MYLAVSCSIRVLVFDTSVVALYCAGFKYLDGEDAEAHRRQGAGKEFDAVLCGNVRFLNVESNL